MAKGIELQFHWIFILIAGAVILTFFTSVAVKQQSLSTQKLQLTVMSELENIFTTAVASKGTAQHFPLPPSGITHTCTETCTCTYSVGNAKQTTAGMFSPNELQDSKLTAWALPYSLPYRVTNFLYLTIPSHHYYFIATQDGFSQQLLSQLTKSIPNIEGSAALNYSVIPTTDNLVADYPSNTFIYLNTQPNELDNSFRRTTNNAIAIDQHTITFYEQDGNRFEQKDITSYMGMPSLYAAITSADGTMYTCGMQDAFRTHAYLSELMIERAQELQTATMEKGCVYGSPDNPDTIIGLLSRQHTLAKQLSAQLDSAALLELASLTDHVDSANRNLVQLGCPELF